MRITKKKIVVLVATTAVVALGSTAAFAYFTSTGTGGGSATVGSATPWLVTVNSVTGGPLFPGTGSETVSYTVTNNGTGPANLLSVTAAINSDVNGDVPGTATGCKAVWFSANGISGAPAGVLAPGGTNSGTFNITMLDSGTNQDVCEGTSPTFTITAS